LAASSHLLIVPLLLAAAAPAAAGPRCPAVEFLYDENEDPAEKHVDTNKDCKHDQFVYYIGGKAERAEHDTNFDGRIDLWTFFEADGKTFARQELDTTGDGEKDRWIQFRDGKPRTQLDDKNADGKPDATLHYAGDLPDKLQEDTNFDGQTDRWVEYEGGAPAVIEDDTNHDGRRDVRAVFDPDEVCNPGKVFPSARAGVEADPQPRDCDSVPFG